MALRWRLFLIVCVIEIIAFLFCIVAWIMDLKKEFSLSDLYIGLTLLTVLALPVFAMGIFLRNYPDKLLSRIQNILLGCLSFINLVISFALLGLTIWKSTIMRHTIQDGDIAFIIFFAALGVFHLVILSGIQVFRRNLKANNANKPAFDFEAIAEN